MERNGDDMFGATGNVGSTNAGSTNFGSTGGAGSTDAGMAGSSQPSGGLDYSPTTPGSQSQSTTGTADQSHRADQLKANAQDKFNQLRDKTRNLQSTLADRLDQGAEKLRNRTSTSSPTLAGATGEGSVAVSADDRAKMQESVARGMQKSADWLRNGDLKADIEHQVRENPGRTLLVALGVGYLLGKAFRGPNR
jgi:hypothetical protein